MLKTHCFVLAAALVGSAYALTSTTRQLNPELAGLGDVSANFAVSNDSQWVVFSAANVIPNQKNLFSVRLNSTAPARQLNDPAIDGGDIRDDLGNDFRITTDNTTVVYRSIDPVSFAGNLFSAPLDATRGPLFLNQPNGPDTFVHSDFLITDDGRVVYRSNERNLTGNELFTAPVDGSTAPVRISQDFPAGTEVRLLAGLDRSQQWAVYLTDGGPAVPAKLFAVNLNNPALITDLSAGLDIPEQLLSIRAEWISASHAVFLFTINGTINSLVYSAALDGSTAPQLLSNFAANEVLTIRPNSNADASMVAYMSNNNGQSIMYVAPSDGGTPALPIPAPDNGLYIDLAIFSPDSQNIITTVENNESGEERLYNLQTNGGGTPIDLNPDQPLFFGPRDFQISPDGSRAVYLAGTSINNINLFSIPLGGGTAVALNSIAADSPFFNDIQFSNDGLSVIFLQDREVFISTADGSGIPLRLNDELTEGGSLVEPLNTLPPVLFNVAYGFTPDETRFIYRADQNVDEQYELFAVGAPPLPAPTGVPVLSFPGLLVLLAAMLCGVYSVAAKPRDETAKT